MSEPSKRRRTSKQKTEPKPKPAEKEEVQKPTGPPPIATVEARHGSGMIGRQARGYSLGEVAKANLNVGVARSWGVLVDDRRRSVLEANVASLLAWAPRTQKRAGKRAEGEVQKIERAVAEEVRKVEKGARREARKIEKEAKKVEEEVVEKIEAPAKKRARKKATRKKATTTKTDSSA